MFKNTSLTTILFFACLTAHAENWRYCAANAPLNSPCKAWVSAYLAGHAPATDAQEVPRHTTEAIFQPMVRPHCVHNNHLRKTPVW